jgi:hypothetical protein
MDMVIIGAATARIITILWMPGQILEKFARVFSI